MNANPLKEPTDKPSEPNAVNFVSVPEMYRLLAQAAELAAGAGLPPEAFAGAAWQAYLRAAPGVAEEMAEAQFRSALEELRTAGRLAKA
jgi:hypothetical protein